VAEQKAIQRVTIGFAGATRKRPRAAAFGNKAEHWWETARACDYLPGSEHENLQTELILTGRLLGSMINRHESFCF
jgi:hypothetical protein